MRKLGLLGLLLALAVFAAATPPPASANACLEACTDAVLACQTECSAEFQVTHDLPAYQACDAACRHEFGICRRSC